MATSLQWSVCSLGSCFHAADAVRRGLPVVDAKLARAVAVPLAQLEEEVVGADVSVSLFWEHLAPAACHLEDVEPLAATLSRELRDSCGAKLAENALRDSLGRIVLETRRLYPRLDEDLAHRERPLREQWEARGPGVLHELRRRTRERLGPHSAVVHLVHPACGGGGAAHPSRGSVRIEGVLTNNVPELPEVIRLAWLLARLPGGVRDPSNRQAEVARYESVAGGATLTAVLAAAEAVDLTSFEVATISLALDAWHISKTTPRAVSAELLFSWWQSYQRGSFTWQEAVRELDIR